MVMESTPPQRDDTEDADDLVSVATSLLISTLTCIIDCNQL